MTTQFDFTNNEWSDIAVLPVLVGYAVARAEDSGRVGTFRELRTLAHSIAGKAPENAARSLIEAASTVDVRDELDGFENHTSGFLADIAVKSCQEVGRVLDGVAEPDESHDYKAWVFDIAHQVARAAKEDGLRVSQAEALLLDRLKAALGV